MEDDMPKIGRSRRGNAGKGRRKGVPNKVTRNLKQAVLEAFDLVGGVEWLKGLAESDPRAFSGLLARLLPQETKVEADVETTTYTGGVIVLPQKYKTVEEWQRAFGLDKLDEETPAP